MRIYQGLPGAISCQSTPDFSALRHNREPPDRRLGDRLRQGVAGEQRGTDREA